jgi:hypothetical protein
MASSCYSIFDTPELLWQRRRYLHRLDSSSSSDSDTSSVITECLFDHDDESICSDDSFVEENRYIEPLFDNITSHVVLPANSACIRAKEIILEVLALASRLEDCLAIADAHEYGKFAEIDLDDVDLDASGKQVKMYLTVLRENLKAAFGEMMDQHSSLNIVRYWAFGALEDPEVAEKFLEEWFYRLHHGTMRFHLKYLKKNVDMASRSYEEYSFVEAFKKQALTVPRHLLMVMYPEQSLDINEGVKQYEVFEERMALVKEDFWNRGVVVDELKGTLVVDEDEHIVWALDGFGAVETFESREECIESLLPHLRVLGVTLVTCLRTWEGEFSSFEWEPGNDEVESSEQGVISAQIAEDFVKRYEDIPEDEFEEMLDARNAEMFKMGEEMLEDSDIEALNELIHHHHHEDEEMADDNNEECNGFDD